MSVVADIADAVVAALNAFGGFSQSFTAIRRYVPVFDHAEMETLHVTVVPKAVVITTESRDGEFFECSVDIGVQQRVDVDNLEVVDALIDLVEEIIDMLRSERLVTAPNAAWMSIAHDPLISQEHVEQYRQVTAIVTIQYRVWR